MSNEVCKVTVVVDSLNGVFPAFQDLINGLGSELDPPNPERSCNLYASPKGEGTKMHFDQQEVFLLQVKGKKHWKIAKNKNVKYPTQGYFGGEIASDLAKVCTSFPQKMPKNSKEFILKPGSVLYIPRGTWHESHSIEESLSLSLTFPLTNWAHFILKLVREELITEEDWRAPVSDLDFDRNEEKSRQKLNKMFEKLIQDIKKIKI